MHRISRQQPEFNIEKDERLYRNRIFAGRGGRDLEASENAGGLLCVWLAHSDNGSAMWPVRANPSAAAKLQRHPKNLTSWTTSLGNPPLDRVSNLITTLRLSNIHQPLYQPKVSIQSHLAKMSDAADSEGRVTKPFKFVTGMLASLSHDQYIYLAQEVTACQVLPT